MDEERIIEKLNNIEIIITELRQELKFKSMQCLEEHQRISKLEKIIFGNGSIGIRTQVFILWGIFSIVGYVALTYLKR